MTQAVCRNGDIGIGICPAHSTPQSYVTTFVSSNPSITVDGIPVITVGDMGICTCGHPTIAIGGSSAGSTNGKGFHRVGDPGTNPGHYTAVTGSPTTDSI